MSTDAEDKEPFVLDSETVERLARVGESIETKLDTMREKGQAHPSLHAKAGWKTVEAHMALLFTAIAAIAALFGYRNVTPEKLQNVYELIMGLVTTLGPLGVAGGVVWNLITSRGKFESNKVKAQAALGATNFNQGLAAQGLFGGDVVGVVASLKGNKQRESGASGAISDKAGDVIGSIPAARTQFDDDALAHAFSALSSKQLDFASRLALLENRMGKVEAGEAVGPGPK